MASIPIAPTPAQPSRKVQPLTLSPRTLNKVSRSLSLVGRVPSGGSDLRRRLLNCPLMMRISHLTHRNESYRIHSAVSQRQTLHQPFTLFASARPALGFLLRKA